MKKFLNLIFVIVITFIMNTCGKGNSSVTTRDLIGTWKLERTLKDSKPATLNECQKRSNVTFTETTFVAENYNNEIGTCSKLTRSGVYTLSGNTITIKADREKEEYSSKISKSGNRITIEDTFENNGSTRTFQTIYVKQQ